MDIKPTTPADVPALQSLLDLIDLFPSELLPELLTQDEGAIWLTAKDGTGPIGLCYTVPEQLADGTWNMRALGVHPAAHRKGVARALCTATEDALRSKGQRMLVVDTSGTDGFANARAFYAACGYEACACIGDFWAAGDDKVTFRKLL